MLEELYRQGITLQRTYYIVTLRSANLEGLCDSHDTKGNNTTVEAAYRSFDLS